MFMLVKSILLGICILFTSTCACAADKYALLVAVTKYEHSGLSPLQYPEEDAKALGQLLKSGGYDVDLLLGEEAKGAAVREKLAGLTTKAGENGIVLVGLFGHGVEIEIVDDQNNRAMVGCFCPFDAELRVAKDSKGNDLIGKNKQQLTEPNPATLVKLSELMWSLKSAKARDRVVFADCCRTVPNQARGRSFGTDFRNQDLPENTSVLFGCSPNEQAFEHKDWGHGAFTKCLLDAVTELSASGGVKTGNLAVRIKQRVPKLVATVSPRDKQTPKLFFTNSVDLQLASLTPVKPPTTKMKPSMPFPPPTNPGDSFAGSTEGEEKEIAPGMRFRWCPPGEFKMGSPKSEFDRDPSEDQVEVRLSLGFWLGETEVTQGQWGTVMSDRPWKDKLRTGEGPDFPASLINYGAVIEYLEKLTNQEQAAGRLPEQWKYTLPTEAQWEYACRAGTEGRYSFGDDGEDLGEYAWWAGNSNVRTEKSHQVGQKQPNAWGLRDMHGNVREWCSDSWGGHAKLLGGVDPVAASSPIYRSVRGGCWEDKASDCRSASRSFGHPNLARSIHGFRVACVPLGK